MAVSVKVGTITVASTDSVGATQTITVGFQPKLILFWLMGSSSATDAVTNQTSRYGFGVFASTTSRYCVGSISTHSAATINGGRALRNDAVIVTPLNTGTVDGLLDVSAVDSTSFTTIVDDAFATTVRVSYMAIGGSDITDVAVGNYAAPTATGNADITTLGFQPDFLLMFGASSTTAPNTVNSNRGFLNIGAASGASNQAVVNIGEGPEGNATSQSKSYAYDGELWAQMFDTPTTLASRAAFVSFLSNGFRLNWLEAQYAYQIFYVAVKGGLWRVDNLLTQTDTSTTIVETGFGFSPSGTFIASHNTAKSTQDTVQANASISVGAFTSASERVAQGMLQEDALTDTDVTNSIQHSAAYVNISTASAVEGLMDVQSIDSDGFTLIMDDADPSQAFAWYFSVGAIGANLLSLSGGMTPSGAPVKQTSTAKTGGMTPSGAPTKRTPIAK